MKEYFGYIRVSDPKQGKGVSLQEQREAIKRCALRNGLHLTNWFEERETAAKRGRPVFTQMLSLLRKGKGDGVIIHKIDRSARNLKDWADLGELIDLGIEVHFANESLDLQTRGGRLSADIQAVVAADYIRNLREETLKGFYGRLKQGLYPLPAPVGYQDCGSGNPKKIDPIVGPLVRKVFELYATGRYTLKSLLPEVHRLGLRTKRGGPLTPGGLSYLLNNPFYIGLIKLRTNEVYAGVHESLISKVLFDRVQDVLAGKLNVKVKRHAFRFRRLLSCKHCGYSLSGELQKARVYYRCHTQDCPGASVREDVVEAALTESLLDLTFSIEERAYFRARVKLLRKEWMEHRRSQSTALQLRLDQNRAKLSRLTDALLDALIEKPIYEERKEALLLERRKLEEELAALNCCPESGLVQLSKFLELAGSVYLRYIFESEEKKRSLVLQTTSNRSVDGKKTYFSWVFPYDRIAKWGKIQIGGPIRNQPRTEKDDAKAASYTVLTGGPIRNQARTEDMREVGQRCEALINHLTRWIDFGGVI